jgi:protein required for attachment to host cells
MRIQREQRRIAEELDRELRQQRDAMEEAQRIAIATEAQQIEARRIAETEHADAIRRVRETENATSPVDSYDNSVDRSSETEALDRARQADDDQRALLVAEERNAGFSVIDPFEESRTQVTRAQQDQADYLDQVSRAESLQREASDQIERFETLRAAERYDPHLTVRATDDIQSVSYVETNRATAIFAEREIERVQEERRALEVREIDADLVRRADESSRLETERLNTERLHEVERSELLLLERLRDGEDRTRVDHAWFDEERISGVEQRERLELERIAGIDSDLRVEGERIRAVEDRERLELERIRGVEDFQRLEVERVRSVEDSERMAIERLRDDEDRLRVDRAREGDERVRGVEDRERLETERIRAVEDRERLELERLRGTEDSLRLEVERIREVDDWERLEVERLRDEDVRLRVDRAREDDERVRGVEDRERLETERIRAVEDCERLELERLRGAEDFRRVEVERIRDVDARERLEVERLRDEEVRSRVDRARAEDDRLRTEQERERRESERREAERTRNIEERARLEAERARRDLERERLDAERFRAEESRKQLETKRQRQELPDDPRRAKVQEPPFSRFALSPEQEALAGFLLGRPWSSSPREGESSSHSSWEQAAAIRARLREHWEAALPRRTLTAVEAVEKAFRKVNEARGKDSSPLNQQLRKFLFNPWRRRFLRRVAADAALVAALADAGIVLRQSGKKGRNAFAIPAYDRNGANADVGLDIDHALVGHAEALTRALEENNPQHLLEIISAPNLQLMTARENRQVIEILRKDAAKWPGREP